jgi:hypothetical protein
MTFRSCVRENIAFMQESDEYFFFSVYGEWDIELLLENHLMIAQQFSSRPGLPNKEIKEDELILCD